jgi:hypothetical protein
MPITGSYMLLLPLLANITGRNSPEGPLLGAVWQHHASNGDVAALRDLHQHAVSQRLHLRDVVSNSIAAG